MQSESDKLSLYTYKEDGGYGAVSTKINPIKLVMSICQDYNLDPKYNEILLIQTKLGVRPYITAAGLRKATANMIKKLESKCIEFDKDHFPPNWVVYRAEIETLDGRFFSAEGSVDISEYESKKAGSMQKPPTLHQMRSKAETRASSRAMRFLIRSLELYDDLPDEIKDDVIKIPSEKFEEESESKPHQIIDPQKITVEDLNLPVHPDDHPEPENRPAKKSELEELMNLDIDELLNDHPSKLVDIESEPSFTGIEYLIPLLENLQKKVQNEHPSIQSLIEIIQKKDDVTRFLWESFKVFKKHKYFDFNITEEEKIREKSPPIRLYERFTMTILKEKKQPNAKHWVDLISEEDQDNLAAYMFYLLYDVYHRHFIADRAPNFPNKNIIYGMVQSAIDRKWLFERVLSNPEMDAIELPEMVA